MMIAQSNICYLVVIKLENFAVGACVSPNIVPFLQGLESDLLYLWCAIDSWCVACSPAHAFQREKRVVC